MDRVYEFNIYYDGMFMFHPFSYQGYTLISCKTPKIVGFDAFHKYLETATTTPITGVYFAFPGSGVENMASVKCDNDVVMFFDILDSYGKLDVYVDHFTVNLSEYLADRPSCEEGAYEEVNEDGENEQDGGQDDNEDEGEGETEKNDSGGSETEQNESGGDDVRQKEHGESSKGNLDGYSSSDVDSVASLDHLSDADDEVREVRMGNPIARIPTEKQLPELGSRRNNGKNVNHKQQVHNEHDEFIQDLIEGLTMRDNEDDPIQPPEPEVPKFKAYDPVTHWRLRRPEVGQLYENHHQLRECLCYYALANGYSIWFERSCKEIIIARCGTRPLARPLKDPSKGKQRKAKRFPLKPQKCTFRCYATWMKNERSFQIRTMKDEHSCCRNFKYGSLINYKWIGKHFAERIRSQPDIKLCVIQDLVMKKYKCQVTHQQVRRAKIWALTEFEKTMEEHYALLRPYAEALVRSNPGSTVQVGATPHADGKTYFERFYVCLHALKEGFKYGCRSVVALDGCFLKGSCNGELLSAVGRDGNNQVYPIAWAIVTVENKDNWTWFLRLLGNDLDCHDGNGLTLMSDQHKGLIEAVKDVMPRAEHRQCARHIYENFRKVYSGVEFRNLFWKASKASYPAQFEAAMKEIRLANPNAYKYLIDRNPSSWSRAFFWEHTGCEAVENGFSECWNSVLLRVRNKPIITLLEALRVTIMMRLENIREKSSEWEHPVCPNILKKLDIIKNGRSEWTVIHAGGSKFEVRSHSISHSVDTEQQTCSCRMWQLSGVPCVHAVNAIYRLNREPEDYISRWFLKRMYMEAYNKYLNPVPGMDTWPAIDPSLTIPLPPKPKKMPGRPKKKRMRASHEPRVGQNRVTKHGVTMTCHKCWEKGHNARTCKNKEKPRPAHIPKSNCKPRVPKPLSRQSQPVIETQESVNEASKKNKGRVIE